MKPNRMARRALCAAGGMLLAAALAVQACAAGANSFLQRFESEAGQLRLFGCALDGAAPEQFSASLGGEPLPITGVSTVEQQVPVTYYCLADISGSISAAQMQQEKDVLYALCDALGENDTLVLGTLGNGLSVSGFLSDPDEIRAAIDALAPDRGEDTNLYAGIVESLAVLASDVRVNPVRCLVILSDGEDDQTSGITRAEAESAVQASGVPVYTVAALRAGASAAQIEFGKVLGSFARSSVGGQHFAPETDGVSAAEAGRQIAAAVSAGLVLTVDTSAVTADRDELLLSVTYTAGDTQWTDTLTVYRSALIAPAAPAEDPAGGESTGQPAGEEEPAPEKPGGVPLWAVALVAVVALAAVGCGVGVWVMRRKKRQQPEPQPEPQPQPEPEQPCGCPATSYTVRLTAIGYQGLVHTMDLWEGEPRTLGRTPAANVVLDAADRRLSGVHCSLCCTKGVLTVRDNGSTNGTFVDGVPIRQQGAVPVADGHTLRVGSYEYRVSIQKY